MWALHITYTSSNMAIKLFSPLRDIHIREFTGGALNCLAHNKCLI